MCVSIVSLLPTDLLVRCQLWSVAALIIKLSSLPEISEMSQACWISRWKLTVMLMLLSIHNTCSQLLQMCDTNHTQSLIKTTIKKGCFILERMEKSLWGVVCRRTLKNVVYIYLGHSEQLAKTVHYLACIQMFTYYFTFCCYQRVGRLST